MRSFETTLWRYTTLHVQRSSMVSPVFNMLQYAAPSRSGQLRMHVKIWKILHQCKVGSEGAITPCYCCYFRSSCFYFCFSSSSLLINISNINPLYVMLTVRILMRIYNISRYWFWLFTFTMCLWSQFIPCFASLVIIIVHAIKGVTVLGFISITFDTIHHNCN